MVNIESVGAKSSSDTLTIVDEAASTVCESTRLPGVVGRRATDDDLGALRNDCLASLDEIEGIGVDSRSCAVVGGLAGLSALTRAYRATVVSGA